MSTMKIVVSENKHAFQKFLKLCCVATKNDTAVLSLMKQSYNRTNSSYLSSHAFFQLLEACTDRINDDPSNKYVHILYFINELKPHKEKHPASQRRQNQPPSPSEEADRKRLKVAETSSAEVPEPAAGFEDHSGTLLVLLDSDDQVDEHDQVVEAVNSPVCCGVLAQIPPTSNCLPFEQDQQLQTASGASNVSSLSSTAGSNQACLVGSLGAELWLTQPLKLETVECLPSDNDSPSLLKSENGLSKQAADLSTVTGNQIRRLEKLLVAIDKQIRKLQEKELSLDEMEDDSSAYIMEDKYKKKFVAVWNKLCQLKGVANLTGRPIEKAVKFEGTKYSEVNRRISRFVNKYCVFPDFQDIYEIIDACNTKFNLGIKKPFMVSLAREAFMTLGNVLQRRRIKDFTTDFGCHLTDNVGSHSDPALTNPIVKEKLKSNRQLGAKRLEEVINKFAEIQELPRNGKVSDEEQTAGDENDESSSKLPCDMSDDDDDDDSDEVVPSVESRPLETESSTSYFEIIILDDEDSNLCKTVDTGVTVIPDVNEIVTCD